MCITRIYKFAHHKPSPKHLYEKVGAYISAARIAISDCSTILDVGPSFEGVDFLSNSGVFSYFHFIRCIIFFRIFCYFHWIGSWYYFLFLLPVTFQEKWVNIFLDDPFYPQSKLNFISCFKPQKFLSKVIFLFRKVFFFWKNFFHLRKIFFFKQIFFLNKYFFQTNIFL